jgi:Ion channel
VTLLGTREELDAVGLRSRSAGAEEVRSAGVRLISHTRRFFGQLMSDGDRSLRIALGLAVSLLVISTLILHLGYRTAAGRHKLSLISAMYFTVETIATVGFGDFSFSTQPVCAGLGQPCQGRVGGDRHLRRHDEHRDRTGRPGSARRAMGLEVLFSFYVGSHPFLIAKLRVTPAGGLGGVAMSELSASIRVIAIGRRANTEQLEHPPRRDTRLAAGDEAYLAGPYEELLSVLKRERQGPAGAGSDDRTRT